MKLTASQIDLPRENLDSQVWDLKKDPPAMLSAPREFLLEALDFLENLVGDVEWVSAIWVIGSITTNQWRPTTDVDIEVQGHLDKVEKRLNLTDAFDFLERKLQAHFNDRMLPQTQHPVKFYVADTSWRPLESDFRYDLLTGEWRTPPVLIPLTFFPDEAFHREKEVAEQIVKLVGLLKSELDVRLTDLKHVFDHADKSKTYTNRLKEVLKSSSRVRKMVDELRRRMYATEMRDLAFPTQYRFSREWASPNITYKYLEMYGVVDFLEALHMFSQEGTMSQSGLVELGETL